jgi:TolB protein
MRRIRPLIVLALAGAFALPASVAHATFPGVNGKLAYRAAMPGDLNYRIYVGPKDQVALTPDTFEVGAPDWSPDGRRIAFSRSDGGPSDIWTVRRDGSGLKRLTNTPSVSEGVPVYSPDGGTIAFIRGPEGDIYLMNPDGTGKRLLFALGGEETSLSWSPDGKWLATEGFRNGNTDLLLIKVATSAKKWVTDTPAFEFRPDWAPDGSRLAFARRVTLETRDIFTVRPDGTGVRRLTKDTGNDNSSPAWSPDGTKIAFTSQPLGVGRDIAIVTLATGAVKIHSNGGDNFYPAWGSR